MQTVSFEEAIEQILAKDHRYPREAYQFVREALDFTQKLIGKEPKPAGDPKSPAIRHVSGQELLNGIREYALQAFGPMAMDVFQEWRIKSCRDFGELVFVMVEHKLLAKTDTDSRADFEPGYEFFDAFRKPFLPQTRLAVPAPSPKPARV